MRSLIGVLDNPNALELIQKGVSMRFKDSNKFKTPEALIIYEQQLLEEEKLLELCSREYNVPLETPSSSFLSREIIDFFSSHECIPLKLDQLKEEIHVAVLPELEREYIPSYRNYRPVIHYVPLHYYVANYSLVYSTPDFLYPLPALDLFNFIVEEAVSLGASDITISNTATSASIYYNVKRAKIYAKRVISRNDIDNIVKLVATRAKSPLVDGERRPKYVGVRLDTHNRGRAVMINTFHGKSMTIRVLPDEILTSRPEDLNHSPSTCEFLRDVFLDEEAGMRVLIGPTSSGKNTTILSSLLDTLEEDNLKVVSIEAPVELIVPNMEQISAETPEEYKDYVMSLLRQNPDLVYISEMTDMTAEGAMQLANTGKRMFTAIHANSIADLIARIQDMTRMSLDRILLNLHSAVYQELYVGEDGNLYPQTRCLKFTQELKIRLLGKSLGEIYKIIGEEEAKWS